jgi:hypothetical protein
MLDIQLAIAKQRGLDLIGEAAADRAAARVARFRPARRKQDLRDEVSCARAAGGPVRIA